MKLQLRKSGNKLEATCTKKKWFRWIKRHTPKNVVVPTTIEEKPVEEVLSEEPEDTPEEGE